MSYTTSNSNYLLLNQFIFNWKCYITKLFETCRNSKVRHCERSEAIQYSSVLLRFARNDELGKITSILKRFKHLLKPLQAWSIFSFIITLFITIIIHNTQAAPIISGISNNEINIDTKFTGAEILLFGAKGDAGDILVVVRGPKENYMINKKGRILGVWHNEKRLKIKDAYSYYSFFSTAIHQNFNPELLKRLEVMQDNIKFNIISKLSDIEKDDLQLALVKNLEAKQLYSTNSNKLEFLDETLFKVILKFPKNISSGIYTVEIYLIDNNNLSAFQSIPIYVNQIGFSAKIHDLAYNNSVLYGIIALLIAICSGWLANFIFNKIFRK